MTYPWDKGQQPPLISFEPKEDPMDHDNLTRLAHLAQDLQTPGEPTLAEIQAARRQKEVAAQAAAETAVKARRAVEQRVWPIVKALLTFQGRDEDNPRYLPSVEEIRGACDAAMEIFDKDPTGDVEGFIANLEQLQVAAKAVYEGWLEKWRQRRFGSRDY